MQLAQPSQSIVGLGKIKQEEKLSKKKKYARSKIKQEAKLSKKQN